MERHSGADESSVPFDNSPPGAPSPPGWLDRSLYPFRSHYWRSPHGRMHYVDVHAGGAEDPLPTVLLVHGTPTWSFLFRDLVRELSRDHRVVAVDHLGFGLSDKPDDAPLRPEDHASRLSALIQGLGLDQIILVVHDFGGPIGLAHALDHPESVRSLVLMNTWMWPLGGTAERASRFFSSSIGRFLYTRLNFSPRVLLPMGFSDRKKLTRTIHRHYLRPFSDRRGRRAPWVLARELGGSNDWFAGLWERRRRLDGIPATLLWGMKDRLLETDYLERWKQALPNARVEEFSDVGHFVPEEVEGRVLADAVRSSTIPSGRR